MEVKDGENIVLLNRDSSGSGRNTTFNLKKATLILSGQ
jgi:hypothetical protein